MNLVFYKCMHCGNVAVKVYDKKVPMMCCGEKMQILEAGVTDAATEKHVPVVTVDGNIITAEIGSVAHPMLEEHLITIVVLETETGFQLVELQPGQEPKATFALAPGEKAVAVYEYCNLHGLWKTEL